MDADGFSLSNRGGFVVRPDRSGGVRGGEVIVSIVCTRGVLSCHPLTNFYYRHLVNFDL